MPILEVVMRKTWQITLAEAESPVEAPLNATMHAVVVQRSKCQTRSAVDCRNQDIPYFSREAQARFKPRKCERQGENAKLL